MAGHAHILDLLAMRVPQPPPESQLAAHTALPASAPTPAQQASSSEMVSHSRGRSMDGQSGSPSVHLQEQQVPSDEQRQTGVQFDA